MTKKDEIIFQRIVSENGDVLIILSLGEFERLLSNAMKSKRDMSEPESDEIPSQVIEMLAQGAAPIEAWRRFRGFSQTELAEKSDLSRATISRLEAGIKTGNRRTWAKVALGLNLTVTMLLKTNGVP